MQLAVNFLLFFFAFSALEWEFHERWLISSRDSSVLVWNSKYLLGELIRKNPIQWFYSAKRRVSFLYGSESLAASLFPIFHLENITFVGFLLLLFFLSLQRDSIPFIHLGCEIDYYIFWCHQIRDLKLNQVFFSAKTTSQILCCILS